MNHNMTIFSVSITTEAGWDLWFYGLLTQLEK